jgi:hypothetical protein
MATETRDILNVLETELKFVKEGGYRYTARVPWRPQFIFQDSPTCLNFDSTALQQPCTQCLFMRFVPEDCRNQKIPCRHVVLNDKQETIDYFYRCGTEEELEKALIGWLKAAIHDIRAERHLQPLAKPATA